MTDKAPSWIKKLRKPVFNELPDLWAKHSAGPFDPTNAIRLEDVVGLAVAVRTLDHGMTASYVSGTREAVLTASLCTYGKAGEAHAAAAYLEANALWLAAVVGYYEASLFCARAILALYGFAPLGRNQAVTLDVFPAAQSRRQKELSPYTDEIAGYNTRRWEHATIWNMMARFFNTLVAPPEQISSIQQFRRIDWTKISDRRNLYTYENTFFSELRDIAEIDVPKSSYYAISAQCNIIDLAVDYEHACHSVLLYQNLSAFYENSIARAGLQRFLPAFIEHKRRLAA